MNTTIIDPLTSNATRVTLGGRAEIEGITRTHQSQAVIDGDGYNINTGTINLTSANKSGVLYIKNNESRNLVIPTMFYIWGNSTGGSGDLLVTVLRNPTTGTVISTATAADMAGVNKNTGSSNTLTADIYKGSEAETFTDGDVMVQTIFNQSATRAAVSLDIIVPKGTSIGIEITPATGNTSLDVMFAASVYLQEVLN